MKASMAALTAALITGGAALAYSAPADAQAFESLRNRQRSQQQQQQENQNQEQQSTATNAEGRQFNLSRAEREALVPLSEAARAQNWAAAQAALPAAQAAAQGADARYLVGQVQRVIGIGTNNVQLRAQGVDAMLASGGVPQTELRGLYEEQGRLAAQANDHAKMDQAFNRLLEVAPNDPEVMALVAQSRVERDSPAALRLYQQAIQAREQAGGEVPELWRRQVLALSYRARSPEALGQARQLLAANPTPQLWHDTIVIYRELNNVGEDQHLDIYRLMRAAQALTSERDYVEYAEAANSAAIFGEVKTALEEGLARNAISPANSGYARQMLQAATGRVQEDRASLAQEKRTALAGNDGRRALRVGDAFYGYGDYAQAAELYRAAMQKGGVDANLANNRLGAALAMGGQRAEAEAAFRAITGPRTELANLWLLWLQRRG